VRLGGINFTDPEPGVVYVNVSRVIPHPDFRYESASMGEDVDDIGLLELSSPVTYTDTILPICLPSRDVDLDQYKVCVDTGFGQPKASGQLL